MKQLSKVEVAKMRQFADFLETVPPRDFDLKEWETRAFEPAKTTLFGLVEVDPGCGFAGCAMGWAAHTEAFDGLRMIDGEPVYKGFAGYRAVQKLLGIKEGSAVFIFGPGSYPVSDPEPGHVAARLRKFAAKVEARINRRQKHGLRVVA